MAMDAKQEPYLKIRDVTKSFGGFLALKDISLDVDDGEFVCFLGPSGCGKTTFLRAIAGLDIQTSGTIEQAGRDISDLPPSERDFGIVFQSYALFPNLTVRRNIAYGLENRRMGRKEIAARVDELLDLVGLPDQGDKYPAQLSGGQQQRIALARAIATSPGLLLLDEPLSALDAKVRLRLRHEIKDLQNRLGVTTVMVTHDQEEALTMADRIVVMNQGVIEQVGTPEEVYRQPATAFVADFIGKMNFVPGTVVDTGHVKVGDKALSCDPDGFEAGAAVRVAIRPENIVAQEGGGTNGNVVAGLVDELEFVGSGYQAVLRSGELGEAALDAAFSVNMVNRTGARAGGELEFELPAAALRLYPAEG